jgi:sphinganine-1-phosphate aldolase
VSPKQVEALINKNTIAIVGSAPTFPHGVIDPIPQLSQLAVKYKIGLHVDCCLGSYLIPFARILGYQIPDFDFSLPGVTTISVDTHKYGYSPKGSSVIMFRNEALRRYMYYVATSWVGGVYASPSIAGSRPGAIVASTWATVMSFGYNGYKEHAVGILQAADQLRELIKNNKLLKRDSNGTLIPSPNDLIIVGDSKLSVVSFGFRHQVEKANKSAASNKEKLLDIYAVNSAISKDSHWHLNTLQNPACVHLCVTWANHQNAITRFMDDLYKAIQLVQTSPEKYNSNTSTQLYGVAEAINIDEDSNNSMDLLDQDQNLRKNNLVGEMAMAYIDTLTWLPTPEEDRAYKSAK